MGDGWEEETKQDRPGIDKGQEDKRVPARFKGRGRSGAGTLGDLDREEGVEVGV